MATIVKQAAVRVPPLRAENVGGQHHAHELPHAKRLAQGELLDQGA